MKLFYLRLASILILAGSLLLAACGVGGLASINSGTPINVALPANGGTVVASGTVATTGTNPAAAASYLIDGVTANTSYWAGAVVNDSITVSFNRSYLVSKFVLYQNTVTTDEIRIQTSANGTSFSDIALTSGTCPSLSLGSGRIDCTFSTARSLRAMRVVVVKATEPSTVQLYELEVTGI
jgi:hypothetical protein